MRLRYLHLGTYPPIKDLAVRFASGSPLHRECSIRFVVGVNGSGKSNLLRAVAEVFLALADERLPPFPVTMVYELGRRGEAGHSTFVLDCQGSKAQASLWRSEDFHWSDEADAEEFAAFIKLIQREGSSIPYSFSPYIKRGDWPQRAIIALPKAVLAYTTGVQNPWRAIWNRNQDADGIFSETDEDETPAIDERPASWTIAMEAAHQARDGVGAKSNFSSDTNFESSKKSSQYRRPILLDHTLLKCALLSLALPQALNLTSNDAPNSPDDGSAALQRLLDRGSWHYLVSVVFRSTMQFKNWNRTVRETAHDWVLCAGEVISHPHPTESQRSLFFDLKGSFLGKSGKPLIADKAITNSKTQGEALLALLGGNVTTAFDRFITLSKLRDSGLFHDIELRLRRNIKPSANEGFEETERDTGVLRYEELSDGEQMVLARMALFHLLQGQQDSLLILDEPETHFNDAWKREIVDIIDEAIGETANDVLISTHSAIVLSDVFHDEIVLLEKQENGVKRVELRSPTFGADPGEVMMRVFDTPDSVGKRAQEWLDNNNWSAMSTEELEQLIAKVGPGFYRTELRTLMNERRRNA